MSGNRTALRLTFGPLYGTDAAGAPIHCGEDFSTPLKLLDVTQPQRDGNPSGIPAARTVATVRMVAAALTEAAIREWGTWEQPVPIHQGTSVTSMNFGSETGGSNLLASIDFSSFTNYATGEPADGYESTRNNWIYKAYQYVVPDADNQDRHPETQELYLAATLPDGMYASYISPVYDLTVDGRTPKYLQNGVAAGIHPDRIGEPPGTGNAKPQLACMPANLSPDNPADKVIEPHSGTHCLVKQMESIETGSSSLWAGNGDMAWIASLAMLGCGISQNGVIRDLSLPRFIKIHLLIRVDVTKLFSNKPDRVHHV